MLLLIIKTILLMLIVITLLKGEIDARFAIKNGNGLEISTWVVPSVFIGIFYFLCNIPIT